MVELVDTADLKSAALKKRASSILAPGISELDIAYLAGIIDGEGSVMLTKTNNGSISRTPVISVASKDVELIAWIIKKFGGNLINKFHGEGHSYEWRITHTKALVVAHIIYPFLQINRKIKRIELMFDYCIISAPGGYLSKEQRDEKERILVVFRET